MEIGDDLLEGGPWWIKVVKSSFLEGINILLWNDASSKEQDIFCILFLEDSGDLNEVSLMRARETG